ncbi:amidohydrolase family protein [Allosediminivita pacifica]|uniref:Putative TIM-barrel fold metal-dependent hydrolase n=1 Tax=Allosediminivita pacifica TaxID=1267769 RepID=A0A2T6A7N6_9RHOB|nr:amidohydrolase family protein [Allosediminivita pacifica]PTX39795.1 putative TIM-barrel fold metal-dependent hydrolase [Allosediminivita pacifica]GGB27212.1 amidohydrolase [Allosediminivita pacifica]
MNQTASEPVSSGHPEEIVLPDLEIIDAHIHLWDRTGFDYFAPQFLADVADGHRVRSSIYVECNMGYDDGLPEAEQPAAEARYVMDQIALAGDSPHRLAEGILGAGNLLLGRELEPILASQDEASQGRFRGVRYRVAFDEDPEAGYHEPGYFNEDVMHRPELQQATALLGEMDLVLDLWAFHTQLDAVKAFAAKVPDTQIVLDHVGGPLGVGRYATMRQEVFRHWARGIYSLAEAENVSVKISGLGISRMGWQFGGTATSDMLVEAWKPYVRTCIDAFGPERAIFGSNFPVDRQAASYRVLLNAFKKMLIDLSPDELSRIFVENARRTYKLG